MSVLGGTQLLADGEDTIVARATADGRGALAVVRLSGSATRRIATALGVGELSPRTVKRVTLRHPVEHAVLDDALATWFPAPKSYTGEDVLELSTHGGLVVSASVLAACIVAGARLALPGEFTRRAVFNGRMDVLQAEAVADLINARTVAMQRQALAQLDGGLSRRFAALREEVIGLEALIAYDIDFPGEDDGPIAPDRISTAADSLLAALDALLATAPRASMLRDGALVVIAGPPNVGKSSLFNALLGVSRALVTPIAGTTRDAIEAVLDRRPFPLRLVDTAGIRDTNDELEQLGIEVSTRYLANAQVVLACGETEAQVRATEQMVHTHTEARIVAVRTKTDRTPEFSPADADLREDAPLILGVSAESGEGLTRLLEHLDVMLGEHDTPVIGGSHDTVMLTRERQRVGVATARDEIAAFLSHWHDGLLPATVAAVHLQSARDALGSVIGTVATDDVLNRVFQDFCIGK